MRSEFEIWNLKLIRPKEFNFQYAKRMRLISSMEPLLNDLRYAWRMLIKNPGINTVAVLTLMLGIGINSALFSLTNQVLFSPLPYNNPERLVMLWRTSRNKSDKTLTAPGVFFDWRDSNQVFEDIAAYEDAATSKRVRFNLTGGDIPERVLGTGITVNFFSLLGIEAAHGRAFLPEDELNDQGHIVLLSNELWKRRFGANPNILGHALGLNGEAYTVVGIMPPLLDIKNPLGSDLWVPLTFPEGRNNRQIVAYKTIARLKPGVNLRQAQEAMNTLAQNLEQEHPDTDADSGILITSLRDEIFGSRQTAFYILMAAVLLVLLIACINVANIVLARNTERSKEFAIRVALGASRTTLIRQLLIESLLLAFIGGVLGLILASWTLNLSVKILPPNLFHSASFGLDIRMIVFTLIVSGLSAIGFGLAPALRASRVDLSQSIKDSTRSSTTGLHTLQVRRLLVISEIALALVLLISAGLMISSLLRLQNVSLGFNPKNVLTMQITLPWYKYTEEQRLPFYRELLDRITQLPGVEQASLASSIPMRGPDYLQSFSLEGEASSNSARYRVVDKNYFQTMSISLLKGRYFTQQDEENSPHVVVINESLARKLFSDKNPIGKRLPINSGAEIIGIVEDVRHSRLSEQPEPAVYVPLTQDPSNAANLVIRTASNPLGVAASVQEAVWAIDKDQPIEGINTMESVLAEGMADTRFYTLVLTIFAILALCLASVGIYGVMSYHVTQRTHEIGIRLALGAQPKDVIRLVLGQGLALVLIGVAIGLAGALIFTRFISSLLYGVGTTDPMTFGTISSLVMTVALISNYIAARRTTKIDPGIALRYE